MKEGVEERQNKGKDRDGEKEGGGDDVERRHGGGRATDKKNVEGGERESFRAKMQAYRSRRLASRFLILAAS